MLEATTSVQGPFTVDIPHWHPALYPSGADAQLSPVLSRRLLYVVPCVYGLAVWFLKLNL